MNRYQGAWMTAGRRQSAITGNLHISGKNGRLCWKKEIPITILIFHLIEVTLR